MNRRHALKALAGLVLCPLCPNAGFSADGPHWSYGGAEGPDHWGDLDAASRVCSVGTQQSPVDIGATTQADLPALGIAWGKRADTVLNNGHTIQVNLGDGSTVTVGKEKYTLLQFHFHRPSEHMIGGKNFPMEVHFVHRNAAGSLGVIGVLMSSGKRNTAFAKIVETMPQKADASVKADAAIDPNAFLPAKRAYYSYAGSLTTPPCAETVAWMLLKDPIQVADADIMAFAKLYPMNARPVQKDNRRFVLRSG